MFCKIFFALNSPIFLKSRAEEEEREKNNRKALWQTQKTLRVLKHRFQSFTKLQKFFWKCSVF